MSMFQRWIGVAALWAGCSSSGSSDPEVTPAPTVAKRSCQDIDDKIVTQCHPRCPMECPSWTCGSNSPLINTFPINGLHTEGCKNGERIALVGTLEGGTGCTGLILDADRSGLIGRSLVGGQSCNGGALKGASFTVHVWPKDVDMKIVIQDVVEMNAGGAIRSYLLVPAGRQDSLCETTEAMHWRSEAGLEPLDGYARPGAKAKPDATPTPQDRSKLAIAVKGDLYQPNGQLLIEGRAGWFNIACARDALAKLETDALAPNASSGTAKRRAALNMLTANYCMKKHYTVHDIEVAWWPNSEHTLPLRKTAEAVWSKDGAECLSRSRLFFSPGQTWPETLLPPCSTQPCSETEAVAGLRVECGRERGRALEPCPEWWKPAAWAAVFRQELHSYEPD